VPRDEGLRILGAVFSSELFDGRAPDGFALCTVFAGGRLDPDAIDLADTTLRKFVLADLGRAIGFHGRPSLFQITRWKRAIPQYVVGHKDRVASIDAAAARHPGLCLLGNWKGGIAMPDCVRAANSAARELAAGRPTR
jgi:oxygen-dependent protoporphyrinogen oxidase